MTSIDQVGSVLALHQSQLDEIIGKLKRQRIETPSWGYGNSGTRFKTFPWPGAARNVRERIADAAYVHRLTGVAPSVALHIPWDASDDWQALSQYAQEQGVALGAVNPNLFQANEYRLGSICNPDSGIRRKAIDHMLMCCRIVEEIGSRDLSVWIADGTNYAGQDDIRRRKGYLEVGLAEVYSALPSGTRMLVEYKFFEPAFYHTDLPDWGTSYAMCLKLGTHADVLVDTGHHPQGTNIPYIVAFLLDEGKLGGFHFNDRKYADDDLIVGSENPFELFLIFVELVQSGDAAADVSYMIDQSHSIEPKLEAMIQSVLNCQEAYAKALLINYENLHSAQRDGDVLEAHRILRAAFLADVRPLLAKTREEMGLHPDPIAAFRADDYAQRIAEERGTEAGGGGYPSSDGSE